MFCTKCGNRIPDGSQFCIKCGAKLFQPDSPMTGSVPFEQQPVYHDLPTSQLDQAPLDYGQDLQGGRTVVIDPQAIPATPAAQSFGTVAPNDQMGFFAVPPATQHSQEAQTFYTPPQQPPTDPSAASTQTAEPASGSGAAADGKNGKGSKKILVIVIGAVAILAAVLAICFATGVIRIDGGGVTAKAKLNDYSWDELKTISGEIGKAADRKAALEVAKKYNLVSSDGKLDPSNTKEVKLGNGVTSSVRIISISHDTKSGSSEKAGLTFQFTGAVAGGTMNSKKTNEGGWEKSAMRTWLANDFAKLLPSDLNTAIVAVDKKTDNKGKTTDAKSVTTTSDRIWLLSFAEIGGNPAANAKDASASAKVYGAEGSAYQLYTEQKIKRNEANKSLVMKYLATSPTSQTLKNGAACAWWTRSPKNDNAASFVAVTNEGKPSNTADASTQAGVVPAFCI